MVRKSIRFWKCVFKAFLVKKISKNVFKSWNFALSINYFCFFKFIALIINDDVFVPNTPQNMYEKSVTRK